MKAWTVYTSCLVAALLLNACSDTEITNDRPVKAVPVAVDQLSQRVKPGLDVSLVSHQQLIPEGVPAEINLSLRAGLLTGQTKVRLELPDSLELLEGNLNHHFPQSEKVMSIELTVYARTAGKHYITLFAENDATARHRALSAIIWAGENIDSLKALETRTYKTDEGAVRELPAEETIR